MLNNLINKIIKTGRKLCIMNYALCIILTACSNPDAGIDAPVFFSDVKTVSAGDMHTVAIKTDGTLWIWGEHRNFDDNLVIEFNPVQVQAGTENNWETVSVGGGWLYNTVAIKSDGSLWAWGSNSCGQLGDGTWINQNTPQPIGGDKWKAVSAGYGHTAAIKSDDTLWVWGGNADNQLGDGTWIYQNTPQPRGADKWKAVSTGPTHTVAIKSDGTLWSWGSGVALGYEQLSYTMQQIGVDKWKAVSAGESHTVAIKSDGSLWAWGDNWCGQLGTGKSGKDEDWEEWAIEITPVMISSDKWKAVFAGEYYTAAIKTDDTLWTWGYNEYGQLGNGKRGAPERSPVKIGDKWKSVSLGKRHTVAIKTDNIVWSWGDNSKGQLGNGTKIRKLTPKRVILSDR